MLVDEIHYSTKVKKISKYGFPREFKIAITIHKILFFTNEGSLPGIMKQSSNIECKKKIKFIDLLGLTKSVSSDKGELVLHLKGMHDTRMKSDERDLIISIILKKYSSLTGDKLTLYGVVHLFTLISSYRSTKTWTNS